MRLCMCVWVRIYEGKRDDDDNMVKKTEVSIGCDRGLCQWFTYLA